MTGCPFAVAVRTGGSLCAMRRFLSSAVYIRPSRVPQLTLHDQAFKQADEPVCWVGL